MQKPGRRKKTDLFALNPNHFSQDEQVFRSITEHIDGVAFMAGPNSIVSYISPAAEKIFGFMPAEMTGRSFAGFLEEEKEMLQTLAAINETCQNHLPTQTLDLHFRRKNGSLFWGELHLQYFQDHGIPCIIGWLYDVTVRKRQEAHLLCRANLFEKADTLSIEELLQATLDEAARLTESTIGFCTFLRDDLCSHTLQVLSSKANHMAGCLGENGEIYSFDQAEYLTEALRCQKTVIHNDDDSAKKHRSRSGNYPEIRRTLVVSIMKDGMVTAIFGVGGNSHFYDEYDNNLVTDFADLANDIVIRKRAELLEKSMEARLIQAQKMALVGKLINTVGSNYSQLLDIILDKVKKAMDPEMLQSNKSQLKNLGAIVEAACSSRDMMSQLLTFARSRPAMPIVLDLNILVDGLLGMLRERIGVNIQLLLIPDRERTLVKVDPSHIDQLLTLLCINARDAIAGNGKITIETGRIFIDEDDCAANHLFSAPGNYVALSVSDNGIGIEKKNLPYIFEPFFTTKKSEGEFGLGLSIAYGIAKQNKGCIDCRSELGKGTTFTIYLPHHTGSHYLYEEEAPPITCQLKKKILLVEGEPEILNLYKRILEKAGYTVLPVDTPDEAIRIASEFDSDIDLLLSEVVLPEVNGCDLSKKLQKFCPKLKTLYLSGHHNDLIGQYGVLGKGAGFIRKPFFINELTLKVHNLLNSVAVQ